MNILIIYIKFYFDFIFRRKKLRAEAHEIQRRNIIKELNQDAINSKTDIDLVKALMKISYHRSRP